MTATRRKLQCTNRGRSALTLGPTAQEITPPMHDHPTLFTPPDALNIDDAFGHWFAGFTDGEGCFRIKTTNMGTYQCRFSIGLRADDAPILREIHERLAIGILIHSGQTNVHQEQWRLEVNSKAHVRKLVDIFDRYPLRAKKAADYTIWREAVIVWCRVENGKRHDWHELAALSTALREGRIYQRAA